MAALAAPVLSMRLGATDQGDHQEDLTTRQAYDILADGFGPGFNGPLVIVARGAEPAALERLVSAVQADEGVARAALAPPANGVSVVRIVPTTSPQSVETDRLTDRLRGDLLPDAGVEGHVGGVTAVFKDFAAQTADRLPYFVGTITGLGFVLLMIAFRSLVVPLTAALMNLVAAAASLGVLVAIFQWGWGTELIGVGKEGAHRGQRAGGRGGARRDQPRHQLRRAHHDMRLLRVRAERGHGGCGRGRGARGGGRRGRVRPADGEGPGRDASAGSGQLVAARVAGTAPSASGGRSAADPRTGGGA